MEILMRTALTNAMSASVLATAVAALGLILSRRPAILHCLWLIVLVKLLTPPMLEVPLTHPRTAEPSLDVEAVSLVLAFDPDAPSSDLGPHSLSFADPRDTAEPIEGAPGRPDEPPALWGRPDLVWSSLGIAWLTGSLAASVLAVVRVRRFQRLLSDAEPADPQVDGDVAALAVQMGIPRPPAVVFIHGRLTPLLWAVGRPRLVIPLELWKGLDARRRTLLLTHELAHLRRGDHWLRLFELAVTIVYWWLPVVWWVRRALRDVEEQCCDAWVVWMFPDEARTYAETLLDTVDFLNPASKSEPLLASGFGKVHHLRKRLTMVMLGTTPRTLGWSGTLGAIALAGVLLPVSPTWAQKADTPPASAAEKTEPAEFVIEADALDRSVSEEVAAIDPSPDIKDSRSDLARVGFDFVADDLGGLFVADSDGDAGKHDDEKKHDDAKKHDEKPKEAKQAKQLRVVVRNPDVISERTKAIEKTIEKLKAQIQKVEGEAAGERRDRELQGLKKAVERLQTIAKNPRRSEADGHKIEAKHAERFVVVTDRDDDAKDGRAGDKHADGKPSHVTIISEDGRIMASDGPNIDFKPKGDPKQIAEARKHVEELSRELAAKQKELGEANRKLAELQGFVLGRLNVKTLRIHPSVDGLKPIERVGKKAEAKDDARLDSLEKKLSKVLDELESLKKQKGERR